MITVRNLKEMSIKADIKNVQYMIRNRESEILKNKQIIKKHKITIQKLMRKLTGV